MIQTAATPSSWLSGRRRVNAMRVPSGDQMGAGVEEVGGLREPARLAAGSSNHVDLSRRIVEALRLG